MLIPRNVRESVVRVLGMGIIRRPFFVITLKSGVCMRFMAIDVTSDGFILIRINRHADREVVARRLALSLVSCNVSRMLSKGQS
jgi:hypothetical protein